MPVSSNQQTQSRLRRALPVRSAIDATGHRVPLEFFWDGRVIAVHGIGRRWGDEAGCHFYALGSDERIYHLLYVANPFPDAWARWPDEPDAGDGIWWLLGSTGPFGTSSA